MELKHYTYLIILISTLAVPLALSFEKNIQYYKKLKYILPAILFTSAVFIMWDISFTKSKIWGFNAAYLLGKDLFGLPVEEWLFFIVIPYSCVFIYEVLKFYLKKHEYANSFLAFSVFLIIGFGLLSLFFRSKEYAFTTFIFSSVYLAFIVIRNRFKPHITKFFFAYFVSLVPFTIVDGILTSLPVVEYHDQYLMNIHIFSIPIEDFFYFFLLLLMVTTIYEYLKERKFY